MIVILPSGAAFMKTPRRSRYPFFVSLFAFTLFLQIGVASAAKKSQDTIGKVVEVNKQALAQLQAGNYDAARDALWNAIAVLNDANMADHEISARTHVHLAAVYMTGFNDRTKAVRQFVMALKINPSIKITPQVETAALDEAFDAARSQLSLAPAARTGAASAAAATHAPAVEVSPAPSTSASDTGSRKRGKKVADEPEPLPPSKVEQALFCPVPSEIPPKEDVIVRCLTQKKPRHSTATLFYHEADAENFTPLPMIRSSKGWLTATVPGSVVTGTAFQFYVSAKVPGVKDPVEMGSAEAPTMMPIIEGAAPLNNAGLALLLRGGGASTKTETAAADDNAPLAEIEKQYEEDEALRKYHRRYVGSFFFSIGGGLGMTYHGTMVADGNFTRTVTAPDGTSSTVDDVALRANTGSNAAGLFQIVPELGYVVSEKIALSLQSRIQYAPYDATGQVGGTPPPTLAVALFARLQYALLTVANFQAFASGVVGAGVLGPRAFMAYIPKSCVVNTYGRCRNNDQPPQGKDHSNVVSSGRVAGGIGLGFFYHLTRWMGIWVEARGLSSVAPNMLLGEANAGLSFAFKPEKSAPPPPKEEAGGWEKPPGADDAPPADAPP
jgi:tetratricopeptide (TPR) repeat protein